MTSAVLCYTDTSLGARIAYLIRITCPILIRYVSSEYPIFLFFANIGYGSRYVSVLRIRPSPITVDSLPSVPDALASDARTAAPRATSPRCDAASPLAGRRPPTTSLCSLAMMPARPHSAVPGGGHPLRPDVRRDIQRGGRAARRQRRGGSGGDV